MEAPAAIAESGGLLGRLRAAGQEFGQWRSDPHAMGSGFLPLTRKAPPAIATSLEIATAGEARAAATAPTAEAAVTGAPVSLNPKCDTTHLLYLRELRIKEALAGESKAIIGSSTKRALWDVPRIVQEYGGAPSDWVKKVSLIKIDGKQLRWIENIKTGQKVDIKFNK